MASTHQDTLGVLSIFGVLGTYRPNGFTFYDFAITMGLEFSKTSLNMDIDFMNLVLIRIKKTKFQFKMEPNRNGLFRVIRLVVL